MEEFKLSVYGENYDDNDLAASGKATEASRKRKAIAENANKEYAKYDWFELADSGKVSLDQLITGLVFWFKLCHVGILLFVEFGISHMHGNHKMDLINLR